MLTGGVCSSIFLFALPIIIGNLFLQLYVTVDAIIVGRFLGAHSLAAVSVASPILFVVVFFLYGGCTGISVLIAHIQSKIPICFYLIFPCNPGIEIMPVSRKNFRRITDTLLSERNIERYIIGYITKCSSESIIHLKKYVNILS